MNKKVATIIIEDYVHITVAGITPADSIELHNDYKILTKNYFHKPEYKLDIWDGTFPFFTEGNRTYCPFILEISDRLKEKGYKIKVKNKRPPEHAYEFSPVEADYFSDYGWEIASHQLKAINNALDKQEGIIKVATNGGKTLITAVLAHKFLQKNLRTIVIVPNTDLIKQTKHRIESFGIDTGAFYAGEKTIEKPVVVSTWQSLQNNRRVLATFDAVMVDECHGSKANSLFSLLSKEGKNIPIRLGLTGTLPEHECDLLKVCSMLGPTIANVKSKRLIDKGWSANLNLLMVRYMEEFHEEWEHFKKHAEEEEDKKISYSEFKQHKLFPEYSNETNYLNTDDARLESIADIVQTMTKEYGNSFILVNTVKFGKKLAKMLGDNAIFVSAQIKDRKPIYDSFETENGMMAIATYKLASTGLDIPRIFNLFLLDGGKSAINIIQSIGRGLRTAKDKDSVNLFDIHSNTKFSNRHALRRKKIYKKEEYDFTEVKVKSDESEKTLQKCLKNVRSFYSDKSKKKLKEAVLKK